MRPLPRPYRQRPVCPGGPTLVDVAIAEQARRVDHLSARLQGEQDRAERKRLTILRDDVNWIWSDIIVWLRDDLAPDLPARCRDAAAKAAESARAKWEEVNGGKNGHPNVPRWLGLILIDRRLRERLPLPAAQAKAA